MVSSARRVWWILGLGLVVPALAADEALDARIDALLARMTLAEKVAQLQASPPDTNDPNGPTPLVARAGMRGIRAGRTPVVRFCAPLQLAATWNVDLCGRLGLALAEQLTHRGGNQLLGPSLAPIKHPLAGGNADRLGEDPLLAGHLAAALARVLQSQGCVATVRDYACASFETGRFQVDQTVPERVLREIYLPAFRIAVQQGRVGAVATAPQRLNGHFAAANQHLLEILQGWGFGGLVLSADHGSLGDAAQALVAGLHVEFPGGTWYTPVAVERALREGSVSQELLDQRVREVLATKLAPGLHNPRDAVPPEAVTRQRGLARRLAAAGMVLLKNNGILPLRSDQSVALIGPFADDPNLLLGDVPGQAAAVPERVVTPRQALAEVLGPRLTVVPGASPGPPAGAAFRTDFPCRAQYFDNLTLTAPPVLERAETEIQKLSFGGAGAAASVPGVLGNALAFYGQGGLRVGRTPAYTADQAFTWCFWVTVPEQPASREAPLWTARAWQRAEFEITGTALRYRVRMGRGPRTGRIDLSLPTQTWTHVAVVRRAARLAVYLNGQLQGEAPLYSDLPGMEVVVGGDVQQRHNATCMIDEIAVYDYDLAPVDLAILTDRRPLASGRVLYESCEDPRHLTERIETYPGVTDPQRLSARWTGPFTAERSGVYCFEAISNGGVRLSLDGHRLFDQMQEAWGLGMARRGRIALEAGRTYDVVLEYANTYGAQRGNGGFVRFEYALPEDPNARIAAAVAAARTHDVALVMVGVPPAEQGRGNDREQYRLPGDQDALVQAVAQANPRTVVVLSTAGGCDMRPWLGGVAGLLEAFYPGQEGGYALRDILYGEVNPSGRLPVTYPVTPEQLGRGLVAPVYERSVASVGYRGFDRRPAAPLFPFGFGLSYTAFRYEDLRLTPLGRDSVHVAFTVRNVGPRAGADVAQVYVSDSVCTEERPLRELKAFAKVLLGPGQARRVEMILDAWAFSFFSVNADQWILEPGEFRIEVGPGSRDLRLGGRVALP